MTLPPTILRALLFLSALTLIFVFGILNTARANTAAVPQAIPVPADGALVPQRLYGSEIAFDVYRNGEKIGAHRTTFERRGDALIVRAQMDIAVEVLFFTAYSYSYRSEARWMNGSLKQLKVSVDDDGKRYSIAARSTADGLMVEGPNGQSLTDKPLFPTNHWHPGVLGQDRVLNTVNGKIDPVTISPRGPEIVKTGTGSREAWQYATAVGLTRGSGMMLRAVG